ncbi:unnamed protein product, partial [Rotaria socialis]
MMDIIANFGGEIEDGDLILFYFSGHCYRVNNENYLLPTHDIKIQTAEDIPDFGCRTDSALKRLMRNNPSYVTIFILDCSSQYVLNTGTAVKRKYNYKCLHQCTYLLLARAEGKGLSEMQPPPETFIQFACGANQASTVVLGANRNSLFTKHLLQNITEENIIISELFSRVRNAVYQESNHRQIPLSMDGLQQYKQVYLNKVII